MADVRSDQPSRGALPKARWWGLAATGVVLVGLFLFDPVHCGFFPTCWFHKLTGWNCPGCGASRAAHALLHGNVATAFHDNPLFVISLPMLAVFFSQQLLRDRQPSTACPTSRSRTWPWIAFVVLLLFGILRNLPYPAFQWMSP